MKSARGRGEGSIEQLPSGKFRVVVSAGTDPQTGKRLKLTETFERKADAVTWRNEQVEGLKRGTLPKAGKLTVGEWLDEWLPQKKSKVEPATYQWYEIRVRRLLKPAIGALQMGKLTGREVQAMHAEMTKQGVSRSLQHNAATTLRAALADAVRQGLLPSNPATQVKKPKVDRSESQALTAAEARALLGAVREDRLAAVYDLGLDAGMRPGEMFGLHWPELDWASGEVSVEWSLEEIAGVHRLKKPKTKAGRRRILLSARTVESLRGHRERMAGEGRDVDKGVVFCDTQGGYLRQSNFRRNSFVPALARAGLESAGFSPYDMRHTSASLLLLAGVNVKVVSQRLGHESIEITLKHYAHVMPGMQELARDAMKEMFGDCPTAVPREGKDAAA